MNKPDQAHAHSHDHSHCHDHGGHSHSHGMAAGKLLTLALTLTLVYAVVEAVAGWWSGSLALLSDSGHMLTDGLALALAAAAAKIALRAPTRRLTFGFERVEVLAALANAGFMLAVILGIGWQAVVRLNNPTPVDGATVTAVAVGGLLLNIGVAWLLTRGGDDSHNLNTRAALLHVMGDLLGSVAALAAGLIIHYTGWTLADPLLSLFICALILFSTLRLVKEAVHTLLEGVPPGLSLADVGQKLAAIEGVISVHDLHIWSLSSRRTALSAHVQLTDMAQWPKVLERMRKLLSATYGIEHVTFQPELALENSSDFYTITEPDIPKG